MLKTFNMSCRYSTPLHDAVACGRQEIAKILIERGANVSFNYIPIIIIITRMRMILIERGANMSFNFNYNPNHHYDYEDDIEKE